MTAEERREKERAEELWPIYKVSGIPVERLEPAYDAGFKAGRSSMQEQAAKVADDIYEREGTENIAAAIRALKP